MGRSLSCKVIQFKKTTTTVGYPIRKRDDDPKVLLREAIRLIARAIIIISLRKR